MKELSCGACGRTIGRDAAFHFQMRGGLIEMCLSCAIKDGPMLRRSIVIALIVGSILIIINQGDLLIRGLWQTRWPGRFH
jgi:hypothetical protein